MRSISFYRRLVSLSLALLMTAVVGSLPAAAEMPPAAAGGQAVPLAELLAAARERSSVLGEKQAELAAAEARTRSAAALADPVVESRWANDSLDRLNLGREPMSVVELGVRQDLPFPGKRGARRQAARAASRLAGAELQQTSAELELRVRSLYAQLYAYDREVVALDAAHELLELLAATATSRYGTGETEQEAVLKVQLRLSLHDERREQVIAARAETAAALRRMVELPELALPAVEALPAVPALASDLAARAANGAPAVALAEARLAAAEEAVRLAGLDFKPDFMTGAAVGYRRSLDPMVTLSFGVRVPAWQRSRQEPELAAAEATRDGARAALSAARAAVAEEVERLQAIARRLDAEERLVHEAVLPLASTTLDAARSAYLAARGDFSTVIEDYDVWLEARVRSAALEAERFTVWARAQALTAAAPPSTAAEGVMP